VQPRHMGTSIGQAIQDPLPPDDYARIKSGQKGNAAPRRSLSLDHRGPSKELFLRRESYIGVPAGVWTNASPKALARRIKLWTTWSR
jgi:hypothetical protein